MRQKDQTIDAVRTIAILLVIYHHLFDYIPVTLDSQWVDNSLNFCMHIFRYMALSLFCFISGILLNGSFSKFNSFSYLKHRFFRIYPLYYIALGAFVLIMGVETLTPFTWQAVIFHIMGLHILLRNSLCEPMPTLWYIGLVFYFDFFLIVACYLSKRRVKTYISVSLFLIFWFLLKFLFNIGDHRFLIYFPVFLIGFYYNHFKSFLQQKYVVFLMPVLLLICLLIYKQFFYTILSSDQVDNYPLFSFFTFFSLLDVLLITFTFVLTVYHFFKWFPLKSNYIFPIIAFASYAVYLFHRPILKIYLDIPFFNNLQLMNYLLIPILLIIVASAIQYGYNFLIKNWSRKKYE